MYTSLTDIQTSLNSVTRTNGDEFLVTTSGPFKKTLWQLSETEKAPVIESLRKQFYFLFEKLNVFYTNQIVDTYV